MLRTCCVYRPKIRSIIFQPHRHNEESRAPSRELLKQEIVTKTILNSTIGSLLAITPMFCNG
jgi:hypothetical protein